MNIRQQKNNQTKTGPDPVVFQRVYQDLQQRIQTLLKNGDNAPLPGEMKLCAEYECSRVTIRRVLGELENEGCILRLPGKGTYPLSPQSTTATSNPHIVWLLSFDFLKGETTSLYIKDFLVPLRYHAANKADNLSIEMNIDHTILLEPRKFAAWTRKHKADAVILKDEPLEHHKLLPLIQTGTPIVLWGRQSQCPELDSVSTDYYTDVKRAVKLLADLGHKQIALIGSQGVDEPRLCRWQAFQDSLTEHRLAPFNDACPNTNHNDIYQHTRSILTRTENRPTAIITGGLTYNWPCLQALASSGLRIPDDISILTIDNFDQAPFYTPPISVVRQPFALIVEQAIQTARYRVANPKAPARNIRLNSEIIFRESLTRKPNT